MADIFILEITEKELQKIYKTKYGKEGNIYDAIHCNEKLLPDINELAKFPAKRGDILEISGLAGYRNHGLLIYDGEKYINLYFEDDDYGSVPPEFKCIKDFPIKHWDGLISHNLYIYIDTSILDNYVIYKKKYVNLDMSTEEVSIVKAGGYKFYFIKDIDTVIAKGLFQYSHKSDYKLYDPAYDADDLYD